MLRLATAKFGQEARGIDHFSLAVLDESQRRDCAFLLL